MEELASQSHGPGESMARCRRRRLTTSPSSRGSTQLLLPVQVALGAAGIPCDGPLTPSILTRTGIRTALAYLRMGLDPGRIHRADVTETVRRPSRGIAPKVGEMLTRVATTSVSDIRRLATRLTGRDGPKLEAYAADIELVAKACQSTTLAALRAIRLGSASATRWTSSTRRGVQADRSTHEDDLVALESVAALHPEVASFEEWLRGRARGAARRMVRQYSCRRSTG